MNYPRKLQELLESVIERKASDLHIIANHCPVLRITRTLTDLEEAGRTSAVDSKGLAFALMSIEQQKEFLEHKEIDFAYDYEGKLRFRVNIFFQKGMVSAALRAIPSKIRTIEELNLPPILNKFVTAKQGLVLITGASSQGKSTTLAALIDAINHQRREHIITIEDPIEYIFDNDKCIIQQREVLNDTLSFAAALRSALREDPDVIMVGEMRDLETISTALTAAETGHLVFATVHTNSASQTIHRTIDVFPPHQQDQISAQLANSLLGVLSQRLLPKSKEGFVPACEVMICNSAVKNLIRENKTHEVPSIIETSSQEGMISFNKNLADLVSSGVITRETALEYCLNEQDLMARLGEDRL